MYFDNVLEIPRRHKEAGTVRTFFSFCCLKCHAISHHLYLAEIAALDPINTINK